MHFNCRNLLVGAFSVCAACAVSNVDPEHATVESSLFGMIDWRPGSEHGASINQYFCSGFLHGEQVGWIQLGAGVPADGLHYRNASASDFGVNVLPNGALRGFAYGANIGWINFEEQGNPRVDWSTGNLVGSIFGANVGWIALEGLDDSVRLSGVGQGADVDGDGMPDAWEIAHASTITVFSGTTDSDGDSLTDRDEFLAGTNPLDPAEKLGPIKTSGGSASSRIVSWPTKSGHVYLLERRITLDPGSTWEVVNAAPIIGTGGEISFNLAASLAGPGFFRIRAFPPLTQFN